MLSSHYDYLLSKQIRGRVPLLYRLVVQGIPNPRTYDPLKDEVNTETTFISPVKKISNQDKRTKSDETITHPGHLNLKGNMMDIPVCFGKETTRNTFLAVNVVPADMLIEIFNLRWPNVIFNANGWFVNFKIGENIIWVALRLQNCALRTGQGTRVD